MWLWRDPGALRSANFNMLGAEMFCTREPHHERAEVFGSQKRKPDTPIGAEEETYRPDTINFSRPRASKRVTQATTSTLLTIVEEVAMPPTHHIPSSSTSTDILRVTSVQETNVNEKLWHIV